MLTFNDADTSEITAEFDTIATKPILFSSSSVNKRYAEELADGEIMQASKRLCMADNVVEKLPIVETKPHAAELEEGEIVQVSKRLKIQQT
jgi:hypothetical protein